MATQQENADIAVLKSQMKTALDGISSINTKLDNQAGIYVTNAEFNEFKKRWFLSHTLAAIAGSILTGTVLYIITHFVR